MIDLFPRSKLGQVTAKEEEVRLRRKQVGFPDRPDQTAIPVAHELTAAEVLNVGIRDVGKCEVLHGALGTKCHSHQTDRQSRRRNSGGAGFEKLTTIQASHHSSFVF